MIMEFLITAPFLMVTLRPMMELSIVPSMRQPLLTNEFVTNTNYARCSYESEFANVYATAFYDEPKYIYMEKNNNIEYTLNAKDKKILTVLKILQFSI